MPTLYCSPSNRSATCATGLVGQAMALTQPQVHHLQVRLHLQDESPRPFLQCAAMIHTSSSAVGRFGTNKDMVAPIHTSTMYTRPLCLHATFLPLLLWVFPEEHVLAAQRSQVRLSKHFFTVSFRLVRSAASRSVTWWFTELTAIST